MWTGGNGKGIQGKFPCIFCPYLTSIEVVVVIKAIFYYMANVEIICGIRK
jgi:hypothetical protein